MYFCPWCGEVLPGALHDKWYNVIRYGYKIGDFDSWQDDPRLPEEMLSDAWWRRRKIGVTSPVFDADWEVVTDHDGEILVGANDPKPGFDRPRGRSPHLCEAMAAGFDDVRDMFAYLPHVREYGVRVLDPAEPVDYQPIRIKPINYCFWCGDALPTPLRGEWERRIAAEGLTPDDPDIPTNLPEIWRTDKWWRDAGL